MLRVDRKKDKNLIKRNDDVSSFVISSCDKNLPFLSSMTYLYVDGLFEYCPRYFLQFFTIHELNKWTLYSLLVLIASN